MKIPAYVIKWAEEIARAVATAGGTYLIMAVAADGFPTTRQGIESLLAGAVPVIWAAVRALISRTPETVGTSSTQPPMVP